MRTLFTPLAAAVALAGAALGPGAAAETVTTATGPADVATPARVAVYDIAALDTLVALGVDVVGVPDKVFLPRLAAATEGVDVVGTLFEPDLEALNAARPDLVIVGSRSSPVASATRRVAPTIDMTIDGTRLVADARQRIGDYGRLFGRTAEAEALSADIGAALARVKAAAAGKGDALVVLTNGPKISVYGEGSRFGWIHGEAGIAPAAEGLSAATHGEAVSFEFIAETDPDWLIVLDRAAAIGSAEQGARATLDNALVAGTTAWTKGQVIYLPAAELYVASGGAAALVTVLDALAAGFDAAEADDPEDTTPGQ